ncbi:hypothetical protein MJT46_016953 [Ovis ammon polii x Ovis aries]|nr:hypothetical protein MJT46_016953 [Ovis ammon polii x Ovis aries]
MWTVERGPGSGCGSLRAADRGGFGTPVLTKLEKASEAHRADCRRGVMPLTPGCLLLVLARREIGEQRTHWETPGQNQRGLSTALNSFLYMNWEKKRKNETGLGPCSIYHTIVVPCDLGDEDPEKLIDLLQTAGPENAGATGSFSEWLGFLDQAPVFEGHSDQQDLFMSFAPQAHPWQD